MNRRERKKLQILSTHPRLIGHPAANSFPLIRHWNTGRHENIPSSSSDQTSPEKSRASLCVCSNTQICNKNRDILKWKFAVAGSRSPDTEKTERVAFEFKQNLPCITNEAFVKYLYRILGCYWRTSENLSGASCPLFPTGFRSLRLSSRR